MRVAFLGLGIMGRPMAANLAKAGNEVTVWNRTPGRSVEGGRAAASPAEAARDAEVVWICVSDTDAVRNVLFGENGVAGGVQPGTVVVDSSTISPSATRDFAARLKEMGAELVDAPVTGSKTGAEAGQLIFIAGGAEQTIERLRPLFAAMGKSVVRMGEVGMGESAKLAMNLQIALTYEGFAEGLILSAKLGVEPQKLLELVQQSMVRSGVVDYKGPFVLRNDFSPNFPLRLMYKDIRLMLEAAREQRIKLPGLETVKDVYEVAMEEGQGDLDYAATLALLQRWAGMEQASLVNSE